MKISKRITTSCFFLIIWLLVACQTKQHDVPVADELNKPLHSFLQFVVPAPQTTYWTGSYALGEHYPSYEAGPAESSQNRVCVQIKPRSLLEPGDHFVFSAKYGDFLPDRITGYLDGAEVKRDDGVTTVLGTSYLQDESDRIVAEAQGPQVVCWFNELDAGQHNFVVEIEKTSGEIVSYGWSFTLTNDENVIAPTATPRY